MNNIEILAAFVPLLLAARMFLVSPGGPQVRSAIYIIISTVGVLARFSENTTDAAYIIFAITILGCIILKSTKGRERIEND